jgi:hypothetical protein
MISMMNAARRLRAAARLDYFGMPERDDSRAGRHSIARLGDDAWQHTHDLVRQLHVEWSDRSGVRPILRHVRASIATYWPETV